jgi:hypothetical protein
MTAAPIVGFLEKLPKAAAQSNGWWKAQCPARDDDSPSFGFVHEDGSVGLACQAGCTAEAIVARLGLGLADLYPPRAGQLGMHDAPKSNGTPGTPRPRIIRTTRYEIRDPAGELHAINVRHDKSDGSKQLPWETPGDPSGLGGRSRASLPLYGSERVQGWPADTSIIVLAEGEKAADAVFVAGGCALATVTGADDIPESGSLAVLTGRHVVLSPDSDEPGRKHMRRIGAGLAGVAASLSWIEPPDSSPKGWDAADATAEQVRDLIAGAVPFKAAASPPALAAALDSAHDYLRRFVVFPSPHEPVAATLWTGRAHATDAAETSPYLAITSPEKRSGKTRLLDCEEQLVPRPCRAASPSEAVTFRKI